MKVRPPAVAGTFYEGKKQRLIEQIEDCFLHNLGPGKKPEIKLKGKREIIGLVSPHAGYIYSGPVAAHSFFRLGEDGKPDLIIILGPNHRGMGKSVGVMDKGSWQTPLGIVTIDEEGAKEIIDGKTLFSDVISHQFEHSLEVQIPYLQYLYGDDFKFIPICLNDQSLNTSLQVGEIIGRKFKGRDILIIASTDFTHYEHHKTAEKKDKEAIKKICEMDAEGLEEVVHRLNISMCGPGPVMVMLSAVKILGAKSCSLLKYATSGDITHSFAQVVGYAALEVLK